MIKKLLITISSVITIIIICIILNIMQIKTIEATVLSAKNNILIVQDENNIQYEFNYNTNNILVYSKSKIKYNKLNNKIIDFKVTFKYPFIPSNWIDNGIFSKYYNLAFEKLKELSLEEKIGQLFLVRYDEKNDIQNLNKYKFGGYVFYKKDFDNKSTVEVQNMIKNLQENSNIPLLTSVDEEGGTVVRISTNPKLYNEPFKSPNKLYKEGNFELIKEDTINKSILLSNLGINLNLAPVVDVSTNKNDYMFERSLGESTELTSKYAKIVIETSKQYDVSYTLKHFPGYGNNLDTHIGSSTDTRSYESILKNDIPPFEEGIKSGAEAILISHNIVTSIDALNPASLSNKVINLLTNNLNFTGIIITDDLDMGATNKIKDASIKALLAGNTLLITTNYENVTKVINAVNNGTIDETLIDRLTFKILAWKYYKGLFE